MNLFPSKFLSDNRKSAIQNRKLVGIVALGAAFVMCGDVATAQQTGKVPRIGYVTDDPSNPNVEAFQQGLRDLGYIEGKNILIEYRYSQGKNDRMPGLVAELVQLKVDVIVTGVGRPALRAAKQAIKTIPIVICDNSGSSRRWASRQLRAPRRKYYRAHQTHPRLKRKTARIA
jgi:ABC-type uncharacterized transport system substrate-binding protein